MHIQDLSTLSTENFVLQWLWRLTLAGDLIGLSGWSTGVFPRRVGLKEGNQLPEWVAQYKKMQGKSSAFCIPIFTIPWWVSLLGCCFYAILNCHQNPAIYRTKDQRLSNDPHSFSTGPGLLSQAASQTEQSECSQKGFSFMTLSFFHLKFLKM